jgi:hypothetical protein
MWPFAINSLETRGIYSDGEYYNYIERFRRLRGVGGANESVGEPQKGTEFDVGSCGLYPRPSDIFWIAVATCVRSFAYNRGAWGSVVVKALRY